MNHLASHVEILLLENDCVVIPGFGGFIAHSVSAIWNKEEKMFLPPARSIGFNPQLTMNDGLLTQAYMKSYEIDYNEANRLIQAEVRELTSTLTSKGKVELPFVGEITYTANESYQFLPYDETINSPKFYGLNSFHMPDVKSLLTINEPAITKVITPRKTFSITPAWRNVAAVAAIVILFFGLSSTPIDNTYVEDQNYANVFPSELFDKIKNQSLATKQVVPAVDKIDQNKVESLQAATNQQVAKPQQTTPIAAKEVKVPKVEPVVNAPKQEKKFYLIISSVSTEADAKSAVEKLHSKGFTKAEVLLGDDRIRVSIASYTTKDEASKELTELRKVESYKEAWILEK